MAGQKEAHLTLRRGKPYGYFRCELETNQVDDGVHIVNLRRVDDRGVERDGAVLSSVSERGFKMTPLGVQDAGHSLANVVEELALQERRWFTKTPANETCQRQRIATVVNSENSASAAAEHRSEKK
jgi:hypothetical protein